MQKLKIGIRAALFLLVLAVVLSASVFAAPAVDPSKCASVSIACRFSDGKTDLMIPDAVFKLYRVASVDAGLHFTPVESLKSDCLNFSGTSPEGWNLLLGALEGIVSSSEMAPDAVLTTDGSGHASIAALTPGLYLLLGEKRVYDGYSYSFSPALFPLPTLASDGTLLYDVTVTPKPERDAVSVVPGAETVTRRLIKIWKDAGFESDRPAEITVRLLADGIVYDTALIQADCSGNWSKVWTDLPAYDHCGAKIHWSALEADPKDYTWTIHQSGTTFILTNTRSGKLPPVSPPDTPPLMPEQTIPQTGQLWWPVPLLLCLGLISLTVGAVRRKRSIQ